MNRQELVAKISDSTGTSKTAVNAVLDSLIQTITHELKKGGDVRLVGFATFSVHHRKAMEGRNPRTGDTIKIPASKRPKVKFGSTLISAVN